MIEIRLPLAPALQRELDLITGSGAAPPPRTLALGARFPARCVYCGGTSDSQITETLCIQDQEVRYDIPYCQVHAAQARRINATINHPRRMSYLLTALYLLAMPPFFGLNPNADLLAVVLVGVLLLVVGFPLLAAGVIRPLVGLVSRPVRNTPAGGILGLSARYLSKERQLAFRFTHAGYARWFSDANRV